PALSPLPRPPPRTPTPFPYTTLFRSLPIERAARFERELGLSAERARMLTFRPELAAYFERALAADGGGRDPSAIANWIEQLIERIGSNADPARSNVAPESLAALAGMVQ